MTVITTDAELVAAVEQVKDDAAKLRDMVQGDTSTVVSTINGDVSSVAKRISEIANPSIQETQTLRDQAETFKNQAETFKNQAQAAGLPALGSNEQILQIQSGTATWTDPEPPSPTTTAGDIIVRGSTADGRLAVGTNNQVLTVSSGTPAWVTPSAVSGSTPTTTTGDIITRGATADERLAIGSTNQVLTVVSGEPAWATPSSVTPTTTAGDLIARGTTEDVRIPIGLTNQVLTVESGTPTWKTNATASPTTTAGDIIIRGSAADIRLGVGDNDQVLTVSSGTPAWVTPSTSSTSLNGRLLFHVQSGDRLFYNSSGSVVEASNVTASSAQNGNAKVWWGTPRVLDSLWFNKDNGTFTVPESGNYRFEIYYKFISTTYTLANIISVAPVTLFRGNVLQGNLNESSSLIHAQVFQIGCVKDEVIKVSISSSASGFTLDRRSSTASSAGLAFDRNTGAMHSWLGYYVGSSTL